MPWILGTSPNDPDPIPSGPTTLCGLALWMASQNHHRIERLTMYTMLTRIRARELYGLGMCKTMKDALLQVVIGNYDSLMKKHLFISTVKEFYDVKK